MNFENLNIKDNIPYSIFPVNLIIFRGYFEDDFTSGKLTCIYLVCFAGQLVIVLDLLQFFETIMGL